jgi:NAD(P)-dependent dehydrogenase (short-subunit alcohol dehydrogenase family)
VQQLQGKVAVITGAASGIGRALSRRCAAEGMQVILADIEPAALTAVEVELRDAGASVLGVLTDVSKHEEVARLAARTLSRFGGVHLLFNNAGVGLIGPTLWETTLEDWYWILGVNLWGVVHGMRVFVPIMLEQGSECHIVNIASAAGLVPPPGTGIYNSSKAAVVALSETLQHELDLAGAPIRVSVVCPGFVRTRMVEAARNRPAGLRNESWVDSERRAKYGALEEEWRRATEAGMAAEQVADRILAAIRRKQLHVFTHPEVKSALALRSSNILRGVDPWIDTGSHKSGS